MGQGKFRIGIDVGGTFTDIVVCDGIDGSLSLHKVPTTPHDIGLGLLAGLRACGAPAAEMEEIAHGTTVATNAVLERKGARTGLFTTTGFRDLLELRDAGRRGLWAQEPSFEPLIPRQWRWEIAERLDAGGKVLTPLDEEQVRAAVEILRREGIQALAVSFLHADQNGIHERGTREILNGVCPGGPVVLGGEVCPFPDERLRAATAALAAYLTPLMAGYVEGLGRVLREVGTAAHFRFIESAGGSCRPEEVREQPLQTILSGPAGGARAGASLAELLGLPSALTADMGGTSFDVAVIRDGQPGLRGDRTLEFGLTVAVPSVDIHTAAIGGGSLVWVDESVAGGLQVGPESAGAHPGPACFGRGGRRPTVTDANLLLGRLLGERTDLGLPPLDAAAAGRAMLDEVCPGLGLDPLAAARVVLDVAEARMASFLRTQLAACGVAPGEASLIAFGGAGPIQAAAVAQKLGVPRVVIPYLASGFSALGCLLSPPARTAMIAVEETLAALGPGRLRELVERAFPGPAQGRLRLHLMLVRGDNPQADLLAVRDPLESAGARVARYHAFTRKAYGIQPSPESVRVIRLLGVLEEGGSAIALEPALRATFDRRRSGPRAVESAAGNGTPQIPVESLEVGASATGPALVVLPGATAFVPPAVAYRVDRWGNLTLEIGS